MDWVKSLQTCNLYQGGLMHRMYKVTTSQGIYAVKHLNAEIMKRQNVFNNYARAEKLEEMLEQNEIPIVPALVFHGKKMQSIEGEFFYVFRWQNGKITDWKNISKEQCYMAGNILGKIHAIEPKNVDVLEMDVSQIDWQGYIQKAQSENSEIATLLKEKKELLIYVESQLNKAKGTLPKMLCVSNEDMDPKNIMWEETVTEALDMDKLIAFFAGYLKAYDNGFRGYSELTGIAYNWVDWLEYNIQRALGNCVDATEQSLGISEVRNTIRRIKYLYQMESCIKEALQTQLAKPDVNDYDTHEEKICYYELLLERELSELSEYHLPIGYRFVPYSDGDRDTWIAIEQSAKEFTSYEQGLEAWNRYYADSLDIFCHR